MAGLEGTGLLGGVLISKNQLTDRLSCNFSARNTKLERGRTFFPVSGVDPFGLVIRKKSKGEYEGFFFLEGRLDLLLRQTRRCLTRGTPFLLCSKSGTAPLPSTADVLTLTVYRPQTSKSWPTTVIRKVRCLSCHSIMYLSFGCCRPKVLDYGSRCRA